MEYKTVMMRPEDNVATALMTIPEGSRLIVECRGIRHEITLLQTVEFGHKFAVRPIAEGEDIVKYGEVIGVANQDIQSGEHVHIHNLDGKRGRGDERPQNLAKG